MFTFPEGVYGDVRVVKTKNTRISYIEGKLDDLKERETQGAFIRLYDGKMWYYSSITDLDNIQNEIDSLFNLCKPCDNILNDPVVMRFEVNKKVINEFEDDDIRKINNEKKQNMIKSYFPLIASNKEVAMWYANYHDVYEIINFYSSLGSDLEVHNQNCGVSYSFSLSYEDKKFNEGFNQGSNRFSDFEDLSPKISKRLNKAIDFLKNSKNIEPGKYPVILSPVAAGVFAHESFGHKSEADFMIGDKKMKDEWQIGKQVGSSILSIVDDGNEFGIGYTPYDNEGTKAQKTYLIKKGVLSGRLHSALTASALEEDLTGNARAINFEYEPIVRMTTTYIENGDLSVNSLFEGVKEGIYVETIKHGSGLSTFTLAPSLAYYVKDGKIQYPVNVSVISGSVFDTLNKIDGLSDKVELLSFVFGGCGKMEQGPLPVGFGGPYVRVSEMDVM